MQENPYNSILNIMNGVAQENKTPSVGIGTILVPPPNIQVQYNNMILYAEDIYINENMLTEYKRTAKGHIVSATQFRSGGGGYAEFASHNHEIDNDYTDTIIYTDTLKTGDKVSVHPIMANDGKPQQYIIESKLVRPNRGKF